MPDGPPTTPVLDYASPRLDADFRVDERGLLIREPPERFGLLGHGLIFLLLVSLPVIAWLLRDDPNVHVEAIWQQAGIAGWVGSAIYALVCTVPIIAVFSRSEVYIDLQKREVRTRWSMLGLRRAEVFHLAPFDRVVVLADDVSGCSAVLSTWPIEREASPLQLTIVSKWSRIETEAIAKTVAERVCIPFEKPPR